MMLKLSNHRFSEAYNCSKVPVIDVPISPEFPSGLKWERPCKCPLFYSCQSTVKQPIGTEPDGTVRMQETVYNVQGCLNTLLPWMITGIAKQSCLAADEAIQTGKLVDKMRTAPSGLELLLSVLGPLQEAQWEGRLGEHVITPPALATTPPTPDAESEHREDYFDLCPD